ncbi:hypothetical protein DFP73DRAFT_587398 [Morchella snyderi]|nr:hypothetical protein DFP73DRAFT_587398 [Morchella snyderi]
MCGGMSGTPQNDTTSSVAEYLRLFALSTTPTALRRASRSATTANHRTHRSIVGRLSTLRTNFNIMHRSADLNTTAGESSRSAQLPVLTSDLDLDLNLNLDLDLRIPVPTLPAYNSSPDATLTPDAQGALDRYYSQDALFARALAHLRRTSPEFADWQGPGGTRSAVHMNGEHIQLSPRTGVLVPRWRAVLDQLDAEDEYVRTHRPWRRMALRLPRGRAVGSDGLGWRVEDLLRFSGFDGNQHELRLAVTRDVNHRITELEWTSPSGESQQQLVHDAIWTLTTLAAPSRLPVGLVGASPDPPSYHSIGDASDNSDIDTDTDSSAADPAQGQQHAACACCSRRVARVAFKCGHRMCRSCVLGTWWGAIDRPHQWPLSISCAFCRAEVMAVDGTEMVEWVLAQSARARVKLWAECVQIVQPSPVRRLLEEMKRRYDKKEGKAPAQIAAGAHY